MLQHTITERRSDTFKMENLVWMTRTFAKEERPKSVRKTKLSPFLKVYIVNKNTQYRLLPVLKETVQRLSGC